MKMLKKLVALLIVLSMCTVFPSAALAAPIHCDSADNTTLAAGHYAEPLLSDYNVISGSTKLSISSLTWVYPTCDITVGFFPSGTTGTTPYGVRLSGGSASNLTITTENVPSGMYWIYIYNNGDYTVNGTIYFSVSE